MKRNLPSRPIKDFSIVTYVVEDPTTGNITDMFSFRIRNDTKYNYRSGKVSAIVNTKVQTKQFVTDLLLCVKQEQAVSLFTHQFGLKKELFEEGLLLNTSFMPPYSIKTSIINVSFYNYNYPKVDEENMVIILCF